jgi:dipeptidyl aminopeptidase/acylaminoacyl peptidase
VWSADGSRIAYASVSNGPVIEVRPASGGPATVLWTPPKGPGLPSPNSWTDDGQFISLRHDGLTTQADIWVLPLAGDRQAISFLHTEFVEWQAQLSPDGRWMAYTSNESGTWEVYVQPFPSTGAKWQISPKGGGDPQWRGDGKELFYLGPDLTLMAVPVRTEPAFKPAAPQPLFLTHVRGLVDNRNHYVVTRDGQQFMFTVPVGTTLSAPMTIVLNWTALLQRR